MMPAQITVEHGLILRALDLFILGCVGRPPAKVRPLERGPHTFKLQIRKASGDLQVEIVGHRIYREWTITGDFINARD